MTDLSSGTLTELVLLAAPQCGAPCSSLLRPSRCLEKSQETPTGTRGSEPRGIYVGSLEDDGGRRKSEDEPSVPETPPSPPSALRAQTPKILQTIVNEFLKCLLVFNC